MHVKQYQKNEPGNSVTSNNPEYQLEVCVFDAKQQLLNQYPGAPAGECAHFIAPNGQPQAVRWSKLDAVPHWKTSVLLGIKC